MPSFRLSFSVSGTRTDTRPNGFSGPATTSEHDWKTLKASFSRSRSGLRFGRRQSISSRSLRSGRIVLLVACCPHVAEVPELELSHYDIADLIYGVRLV